MRKAIAIFAGFTAAFMTLIVLSVAIGTVFGYADFSLISGAMIAGLFAMPAGGMAHDAILGKTPGAYWREHAPELSKSFAGFKTFLVVVCWLALAGIAITVFISGASALFSGWPAWAIVITTLLVLILLK